MISCLGCLAEMQIFFSLRNCHRCMSLLVMQGLYSRGASEAQSRPIDSQVGGSFTKFHDIPKIDPHVPTGPAACKDLCDTERRAEVLLSASHCSTQYS